MGKSLKLQTYELIDQQFNPLNKFLRDNSKKKILDTYTIERLKLIEEKAKISKSDAEEFVKLKFNCEIMG